jgi:hypothetical protein
LYKKEIIRSHFNINLPHCEKYWSEIFAIFGFVITQFVARKKAIRLKAKLAKQEPIPPNVTIMGRFFLFREVRPRGDVPGDLWF